MLTASAVALSIVVNGDTFLFGHHMAQVFFACYGIRNLGFYSFKLEQYVNPTVNKERADVVFDKINGMMIEKVLFELKHDVASSLLVRTNGVARVSSSATVGIAITTLFNYYRQLVCDSTDSGYKVMIPGSEYDNEGERLRELWIQLGFNEIIATCDNNDYDWLVCYQPERIEDFVILDIRL
jgi:hypothetical protein